MVRPGRADIPRVVLVLIAGVCLLDALFIAGEPAAAGAYRGLRLFAYAFLPAIDPGDLMSAPVDLLREWITRRASPEATAWFDETRADLVRNPEPRAFASSFSMAARRMGKADLDLASSDLAAAAEARPAWRPAGLTVDQAARIALLLDSAKTSDAFAERLKASP